jgi:DNA-binding transcriptional MerR regulator
VDALYPVGTVVRLTGLSARRIRYYERLGLVVPAREGNRRLYTDQEVARLREIRDRLLAGQNLKAVRRAMGATAPPEPAADPLEESLAGAPEEENDVEAGLMARLPTPRLQPLADLGRVQRLMERHAQERGRPVEPPWPDVPHPPQTKE